MNAPQISFNDYNITLTLFQVMELQKRIFPI